MRKKLTALVIASACIAGTASAAPAETGHKGQLINWSQNDNPGKGTIYMGTGSQGKGQGDLHGIGVGHGKGPASPH